MWESLIVAPSVSMGIRWTSDYLLLMSLFSLELEPFVLLCNRAESPIVTSAPYPPGTTGTASELVQATRWDFLPCPDASRRGILGVMAPTSDETPQDVDVLLKDGSTAQLRPIRPDDASSVVLFHSRLSAESVRLRFFTAHPHLSEEEVDRLTHLSGGDDLALVALRGDDIVAIAQYDRSPESDEAEVAFVVDDHYHGKGLSSLLLERLAAEARRHGIKRFVAQTLWENQAMRDVLHDAGFAPKFSHDADLVSVVLDIAPSPEAVAAADERDRVAVVRSMARLLQPRSIAVIGASRSPGTIGHELVTNLVMGGFGGPVYPVNPSATAVASLPCWSTIEDVPGDVDLAVVAVPAPVVADVVAACGRKHVGGLVLISAGFAETGAEGAVAQRHITRVAHANGMRIIGPNCFGVINTDPAVSMNATFAAGQPIPGAIGFASQSGGLGIAILAEAHSRGLGLSCFVSMGNKADVSGNDLLTWWEQDDATRVILLYLESFGNPRKFSRIARRVGRQKPIVAVKSGRSSAGTRAASSHTAALASSEQAVDALFRQTGVVRVDTIEELFDVAAVLVDQPLPSGRRVAVMGNAGGPGVLAADACSAFGLVVPELSPTVQEELRARLPDWAGLSNPIDLVASATAETYRRCLEILLGSDEVDSVVVIFTPPLGTQADDVASAVARAVADADAAGWHAPVVTTFLGSPLAAAVLHAERRSIPNFGYPETAVRALAHVVDYAQWRRRPPGIIPRLDGVDANEARRRVLSAAQEGAEWITGTDAMEVLSAYGIDCVPTISVSDVDEAVAASTVGLPVVVKAFGPDLVHKTEVGAVRLDLRTEGEVREAFESMRRSLGSAMVGAVVQPMIHDAVETIVGFAVDPAFGPQVLFGLGGTAVELLGDHVSRLTPLTDVDARDMVLGLRGTPLLTGFRGSAPVDLDALTDLVLRMGRLAEDLPELIEADCNPVMATPGGAMVVDARLRVSTQPLEAPDDSRHLK
jgi:acetyl coenzyme A synthetase (ADP forming)-like protein